MAVQINRSHHLDKATTRRMVEDIATSLSNALSFSYRWQGDRLVFNRTGIRGHIDIVDHEVRVFVSKSPLLPVSESWIRKQVEEAMDEHLGGTPPL